MYSRSTERRGRTHLPPGYDGNAFRHDTGERRSLGDYPTETKVHEPMIHEPMVHEPMHSRRMQASMEAVTSPVASIPDGANDADTASETSTVAKRPDSFLSGMLDSLGQEEWLLFFLLLLLLADGSDAWELILLLLVLLAVR